VAEHDWAIDSLVANSRAILAAEILDGHTLLDHHETRVPPRHLGRGQTDQCLGRAPDDVLAGWQRDVPCSPL